MRQLEKFDAWRLAHDLAAAAYGLTLEQPLCRHFALIDQIRRAAISIPANIAEGYALATRPQFVRCLRISLGSAAELSSHLRLVERLALAHRAALREARELCARTISVIVGLLRKLSR